MDGSRLGFVLAATFASCSLAPPSLEEATQTTDSGSSSYQPSQTSDSITETLPPVTMDCDLPFRPSDQPETCIFAAGTGLCHVESRYPLSGYGIIKNAEDFDHDGRDDLVVVQTSPERLEVFRSRGDCGEYGGFETRPTLTTEIVASSVVLDANGDGFLDIFASLLVDLLSTDDILINTVDRHSWLPAGCPMPVSVVGGDFNGDGLLDLAGIVPGFNNVPDELQVFIAVAD